jgi:uncharacterized protein (TIGR03435 family)
MGLVAATGFAQGNPSHGSGHGQNGGGQTNPGYQVHVTPTTMPENSTSMETGTDAWIARGFDLRTLIAQVYDIDVLKVDFPDSGSASAKYDVSLNLQGDESPQAIQSLLQDALKKKFNLVITTENHSIDVYVITAPNGPGTGLHPHPEASFRPADGKGTLAKDVAQKLDQIEWGDTEQISFIGRNCSGITSGYGIKVSAGSMSEFRRTLEPDLDRLLIDETKLGGTYDFEIGGYTNKDDLFQLLRDQLGLVVTPTQRKVDVLTVRISQDLQASNHY